MDISTAQLIIGIIGVVGTWVGFVEKRISNAIENLNNRLDDLKEFLTKREDYMEKEIDLLHRIKVNKARYKDDTRKKEIRYKN